jgi:hypothetical protein
MRQDAFLGDQAARRLFLALTTVIGLYASAALAASVDVDAKMEELEVEVSAEAVALAQGNMGPEGILKRLATPAEYARITDPQPDGSSGDPSGRPQVPCAQIAALKPVVILVAGQSNAANTAEPDAYGKVFRTDKSIYNLLFTNGACYRAENPLLGADGVYQSFALPLAARLIDAGIYQRVLLVPISVSGTLVEEWAPSGHYWNRFTKAIAALDQIGLGPDFVLWHQGEGNAGLLKEDLNASQTVRDALRLAYTRNFLSIVDGLRSLGVQAPVFVAVATQCGSPKVSSDIRAAQLALPDLVWKIYQGPDTDVMDFSYRGEENRCHFSHEGNQAHAEKWYEVLRAYLAANPPHARLTPEVQMQANQSAALRIKPGGSYTLSYSSVGASSCTMFYRSGASHDSFPVPPNATGAARRGLTGSYELVCTSSAGGRNSATVTVSER